MANVEPAFGQPGMVNVSIVVLGFMSTNGFASLPYIAPGITFAVEQMQKKYSQIIDFKVDYIYHPVFRTCLDAETNFENMVAEWHYRKRDTRDITVYIESACVDSTELAYFQTQWDTLWISTVSASSKIRNRQLYPSWLCFDHFLISTCSDLYIDVLNKYSWTSIFVIVDNSSPPFFFTLAQELIANLRARTPITPVVHSIDSSPGAPFGEFRLVLGVARKVSRIILFFGLAPLLRELLITASSMNMTNGQYVYIACENKIFPTLRWQYNDTDDPIAYQAFQSLLIVHLSDDAFSVSAERPLADEFLRRSEQEYNFTYPLTRQPYSFIKGNCMAVTTLAEVLNETLTEGANFRSGLVLAQKFLNRTFSDAVCHDSMFIGNDGQRSTYFSISPYTPTGNREPFLQQSGKNIKPIELRKLTTWVNATFPPPNEPLCGFLDQYNSCLSHPDYQLVYVTVFTLIGLCIAIGIATFGSFRHSKRKAENQLLYGNWWQMDLQQNAESQSRSVSPISIRENGTRHLESGAPRSVKSTKLKQTSFAIHERNSIMCTKTVGTFYRVTFVDMAANVHLLLLLRKLKALEHMNVCRFYGLTTSKASSAVWIETVSEWPTRGALPKLFESFIVQDVLLVQSLVMDYLDALRYIHCSSLQYHGRLSVMACWIDRHFTLKLAHVAMDRLHKELATVCQACSGCENMWECVMYPWKLQKELSSAGRDCSVTTENAFEYFYWSSPGQLSRDNLESCRAADVYSSGMVICDLLTMGSLYHRIRMMCEKNSKAFSPTESELESILISLDFSQIKNLELNIRSCWNRDPDMRPSVHTLWVALSRHMSLSSPDKRQRQGLFDNIHGRLVSYSSDMEYQVFVRTKELKEEMQKCDDIIGQFLPRSIVKELRAGRTVSPEFFERVTVMFTDLFGFADLVHSSSPESIIVLIDQTEIYIDRLSTEIKVYKIEAVGDSFMIASGLPDRCGNDHIARIASFALKLRDVEQELFYLQDLRFKTGFHSGPCAAGQMGLKRPRYCLFGDTVNTASRMCSHGLPSRIHLSPDSQALLDGFKEFIVEPRGLLAIKGKSEMTTYWLLGKHGTNCVNIPTTHIIM